MHARRFGLFRVRSPLLAESLLFSVPAGTEMVHFPALPSIAYVFSEGSFGISQRGFPHSEIPGSKLVCSSPGLIAAYRVLHRLLAPRHSPYALSSLTTSVSNSRDSELCDSQQRQLDLFSHCVVVSDSTPCSVSPIQPCSKRTTVCRIFSCQRTFRVAPENF